MSNHNDPDNIQNTIQEEDESEMPPDEGGEEAAPENPGDPENPDPENEGVEDSTADNQPQEDTIPSQAEDDSGEKEEQSLKDNPPEDGVDQGPASEKSVLTGSKHQSDGVDLKPGSKKSLATGSEHQSDQLTKTSQETSGSGMTGLTTEPTLTDQNSLPVAQSGSTAQEGEEEEDLQAVASTDTINPIYAVPPKAVISEEGQFEVSSSPAFQCLDELFHAGKLTGTKVSFLKAKYTELHEMLRR